jgi:hypothetical protein
MNGRIDALRDAAVGMLDALIKGAGAGRAPFRCLTTIFVNGTAFPALMVGTADGMVEDGEAIAILNPDEDLLERFRPGVGYHGGALGGSVSGKCDAMVHVWLDAYSSAPTRAKVLTSYAPTKPAGGPKLEIK